MLDKKKLTKIGIVSSVIALIIFITFTISAILVLNTNYLEEGILTDQTKNYNYIAEDVVSQLAMAEDVLGRLENNTQISMILNTEHANASAVADLYNNIDFDNLFANVSEEYIYENLTIYTSNETVIYEDKFHFISSEIENENWYLRITQSRRKSVLFVENNTVNILYKMVSIDETSMYTNIGVVQVDLAFLENVPLENYRILISNVFWNNVEAVSGDRELENSLTNYSSITNSSYLEDEMVLVYTIIPGTSLTRTSLIIVLDKTNFVFEFFTYSIAILSAISAIIFVIVYRINFIKKMDKSSHALSFDDIEATITKNQPNKIDHIIKNMYTRIEALVKQNQELDVINQQVEAQKNEAEIKALLSQIDPHYIFNLLNSIHKRALKNKEMESAKMILLMSKQLRRSLEWKEPFVSIKDEFEHIRSYIALQQYYSGSDYIFTYDIDETLYDVQIPKLIFQTLIENAIKHGDATKPFRIGLEKSGKHIRFMIKNEVNQNAKNIQEKIIKTLNLNTASDYNDGIGLQNLTKRLRYYYKDQYQIIVQANKQSISVIIEFPE